ncbi:hypothetical protein LOTGIDRAFT_224800 [Lottia gigantea]|uniref:Dystroglycan 1 n=1 Tax=Lottia gigantea TaxID=225164 RepID=V4B4U7_LOTGI|nr:hypothetical protein LOTGIDRAFT_224800 [Lottia gigantea]ESP02506.1 hypothetical protein LOTGIDRAFT_224800 [Lottia gigantea]
MCTRVKLFKPVFSLFLIISLVNPGLSLGDSNLLNLVDKAVNSGKSNDIGILWGIPDATAHVGHFFNYSIPKDAFKGQSLQYQVTEAGKNILPSWLSFDPKKEVLQGIPLPTDVKQHYIEVIATDKNNQNAQAKDIFTIDVVTERNSQPATTLTFVKGGPKMVRCKREQPETKVTIILDTDLEKLTSNGRLDLLNRFSYLNLIPEMLKMIPVNGNPITDDTALVSGPGNVKEPKESGVFVSWRVGCGTVDPGHLPILQQVEAEAQNGQLAEALKNAILSWHVTNSRFQEHKRHRRAIRATPLATPGVQPTIPQEPPTMTKPGDEMTRPVIGEASPTFSIQPTQSMTTMKTDEPGKPTPTMPMKPKPTGGIQPSQTTPETTDQDKTMPLPKETIFPTKTDTDSKPTDSKPGCIPNLPPNVENPIGRIEFMSGEFHKYKIPKDTFSDCEVGNTRNLELELYANSTDPIPKSYWMKLDHKRQQLVAFPTPGDSGVHKFTLVAKKGMKGLIGTHSFKVKVKGGSPKHLANINHEVSITLDVDYDKFMSNITNRLHLVNRLAKAFGDRNHNSIQLTGIERGSVIIKFTNTSLSGSDCPVQDLKDMFSKFMNDDGTIKPEAEKALKPYKIQQAGTIPKGGCLNNPDFPELLSPYVNPEPKPEPDDQTTTPMTPEPETTTEKVATGSAKTGDDIWITTVVPAVVIVAILLIALLVACILYRKKRKGKMSLEDKNTFVNKGVPVILPDELDENEKQQESSKPLIMADEKPPITSPEYRAGSSEASTPPANHRNMMADDPYIEDVHSPLYQPPPPVQSAGGNRQPRPHMQSYNKPTAYVPP